jgi:hypothetical protein
VTATANTHGSVMLTSGTVSYSPNPNYNGPASFAYQVCDNGTTNSSADAQCTGYSQRHGQLCQRSAGAERCTATASVTYSDTLTFNAAATDVDLPPQTLIFSRRRSGRCIGYAPADGEIAGTPASASTGVFSVTVTDGESTTSSQITVTVNLKALTSLGPAQVWLGLKNSDDVGTRFDLLAEVFRNGSPIGSGQLNDVSGGGSGFNSAVLRSITLAQSGAVGFRTGDQLSIRLSVRIAASADTTAAPRDCGSMTQRRTAGSARRSACVSGAFPPRCFGFSYLCRTGAEDVDRRNG